MQHAPIVMRTPTLAEMLGTIGACQGKNQHSTLAISIEIESSVPMDASEPVTLAELVSHLRSPIMNGVQPTPELLKLFVLMIEMNDLEWGKVPDNDHDAQRWAEYLVEYAKTRRWIRSCINQGLLPERYSHWPDHNWTYRPKLKEAKSSSKSVVTISGGAFEQNRRKH